MPWRSHQPAAHADTDVTQIAFSSPSFDVIGVSGLPAAAFMAPLRNVFCSIASSGRRTKSNRMTAITALNQT